MSTYEAPLRLTYVAGEDLSESVYCLVKLDANGRVVKTTSDADYAIGVLGGVSDPDRGAGDVVTVVALHGTGKLLVKTGDAVARGNLAVLHATADGAIDDVADLATATAGKQILGVVMEAATAANQVVQIAAVPAVK